MTQPDPLSILAWLPDLSDCTRLVDAFLAGRRPTTLAACRADLEDFRCYTGTSTVAYAAKWLLDSPQDFAKLLVSLYQLEMSKRGLQATTINRRLATLRSLVKLGNTHGLVTWTLPVENVPVPSYGDTCGPDRDGFRAMLDAAGAQPGPKGRRNVALLRLLHDLGLRRSEAVRLDIEDVELQRNWIFIPGKGRAPRELVSLPEPTRAALAAWLEAHGSEPGPLFINFDRAGKGHRLTGAAVYHIVGWLGARAGLTVRPHGLRHLAIATALERTNGDMRAVATFSRHKDLRTLSPLQNELRTANHLLDRQLGRYCGGFRWIEACGLRDQRRTERYERSGDPGSRMMRDQSSVEAAPATLRLEESQPGLGPNKPQLWIRGEGVPKGCRD